MVMTKQELSEYIEKIRLLRKNKEDELKRSANTKSLSEAILFKLLNEEFERYLTDKRINSILRKVSLGYGSNLGSYCYFNVFIENSEAPSCTVRNGNIYIRINNKRVDGNMTYCLRLLEAHLNSRMGNDYDVTYRSDCINISWRLK